MRAKVTKEFKGRRDHEAVTRTFRKDDIVEGDLATVAVREKWAVEIDERSAKADKKAADEAAAKAAAEAKAKEDADKKAADSADA